MPPFLIHQSFINKPRSHIELDLQANSPKSTVGCSTAIATEGPTEAPQEEPTPAPTPDPAEAIAEVFPFLSREEFVEAEEQLEVDGAECLRSYRMGEGTVYVNVF